MKDKNSLEQEIENERDSLLELLQDWLEIPMLKYLKQNWLKGIALTAPALRIFAVSGFPADASYPGIGHGSGNASVACSQLD
jgi:hypothetical protein